MDGDIDRRARNIDRTAKRLYDGLRASPVEKPEDVCAVLGAVIGSFAIASGEPVLVMTQINEFAQGVIDGSLTKSGSGR